MATQKRFQTSGVTTGTTAVTVIAAPESGNIVRLESLVITNKDTVDGVVIVNVDDDGTSREIVRSSLNAGVAATGTLTFSGVAVDTETLVIGTKTYTWDADLSNVDGNIDVGVNQAGDESNLTAAINLGAGGGTAYATLMAAHPSVTAADTGSTVVVTAIANGAAGNAIPSTQSMANATWGATTLAGGEDPGSVTITAPIILASATDTLEIVLGWPVTTTEFDYVASWLILPLRAGRQSFE